MPNSYALVRAQQVFPGDLAARIGGGAGKDGSESALEPAAAWL